MCEDFLKLELFEWKEIDEIKKLFCNNIQKSKKILFINRNDDDVDKVLKHKLDSNDINKYKITGNNYIIY